MPATSWPDIDGLPPQVAEALERLKTELVEAAPSYVAGLVLFGGLARGSYHEGFSDVNVVLLLHEASAEALAAVAPALQRAWRGSRIEPLILTPAEVPRIADAFPTKLLDIQEHHRMLLGEDPFTGLDVSREHLRLRIEQELRNLQLRLRRRYIAVADDPAALAVLLANIARPLAIELEALLRLTGQSRLQDNHTATIFAAAASAFQLDAAALARLAELRDDQSDSPEVTALFPRVLLAIGRATEIVDTLDGARP